jgi:plasmid stabilization system protein ParE
MVAKQKSLIIEWTETAEHQFQSILEYWINHNKSTIYSEKLTELVWESTKFLASNPNASPKTTFRDTYKTALGHYSIFYKVIDTKILITAFWDNRQDPKKLFVLLKEK